VPNDSDARTLKFLKSNYGPKGKPMSLRWQNGLFVPDLKLAKTPAEADAMFLTMLDKYVGQNRTVSANKSSPIRQRYSQMTRRAVASSRAISKKPWIGYWNVVTF